MKELVVALCHDVYGAHLAVQDEDYYDEIRYHAMVEEAAGIYEQAKVIFQHWRDDTSTYYGDDLLPSDASTTSLAKIYRIICGLANTRSIASTVIITRITIVNYSSLFCLR